MPGIFTAVASGVEIAVVARQAWIKTAVGSNAVQTIIALVGVEATFRHAHTDDGVGIDAEALQAFGIGVHMRFADQRRAPSERAQIVAQRHFPDLERYPVPIGAMRLHVPAGVEAHA